MWKQQETSTSPMSLSWAGIKNNNMNNNIINERPATCPTSPPSVSHSYLLLKLESPELAARIRAVTTLKRKHGWGEMSQDLSLSLRMGRILFFCLFSFKACLFDLQCNGGIGKEREGRSHNRLPTTHWLQQYTFGPKSGPMAEILLLLGRDMIKVLKVREQVNWPYNAPFAQRLDLGWVLVGEVCLASAHKTTVNTSLLQPCTNILHIKKRFIMAQGKKMWSLRLVKRRSTAGTNCF